jgi:hypothetical protein
MQGRELVATIQAVLEVQTRAEQRELVQKMTVEAGRILENSGISNHQGEIFEFLRTLDKQMGFSSDNDMQETRKAAVANRLRVWGVSYFETALKLGEQLELAYAPLRKDLFRSRSRSAHVGAVLRPFRQKYIELWAEALGENFNREQVMAEVQRLNSFPVETEISLYRWSDEVFELFRSVAIIETPEKGTKASNFKKPLGMIGSNSEKTYKQQWDLWMKRNAFGILTGDFKYNTPIYSDNRAGFNQGPAPVRYRSDYEEREMRFTIPEVEAPQAPAVSPQESNFDKVTLRIECVDQRDLSAERTWLNRDEAISELGSWISSMGMFWGGDDVKIAMELELTNNSGESKFKLPPIDLGSAGQTLSKALSNYK